MEVAPMNIAILMMQKNEDELLGKWIAYHSYLVGHQNLFIYDNGSTSERTLEALSEAKATGVNVITEFASKQDYENRGQIFANRIKELDELGAYDFYMLIDCDEYLACVDEEGVVSCDRLALQHSLKPLINRDEVLMIDGQYYNSSISKNWFNKQPYRKCFFRRGNIESLDQGFHWGKVKTSNEELRTNLVHVHFHNKPFEIAKSHAKEKLTGRVESFDIEYLRTYKGKGFHLTRFFFENEEQFVSRQVKLNHIYSASLVNKFNELNIEWPYDDEVEKSRAKLALDDETKLFTKVLPVFRGSLDTIEHQDSGILLRGWGILRHSRPIKQISVEVAGNRVTAEIKRRYKRSDVNELLNVEGLELGFDAFIPVNAFSHLTEETAFGEVKSYLDFDGGFYCFDMRANLKNFDYISGKVVS